MGASIAARKSQFHDRDTKKSQKVKRAIIWVFQSLLPPRTAQEAERLQARISNREVSYLDTPFISLEKNERSLQYETKAMSPLKASLRAPSLS